MRLKIFGYEFKFEKVERSSLTKHAKTELDILRGRDKLLSVEMKWVTMMEETYQSVFEMVESFSKANHSGSSALHAQAIFNKLVMFQPLSPLTGGEEEWEYKEASVQQNKRCSSVFRRQGESGQWEAWDINGVMFEDEIGAYWNSESRIPVKFPYSPKTEVRKV